MIYAAVQDYSDGNMNFYRSKDGSAAPACTGKGDGQTQTVSSDCSPGLSIRAVIHFIIRTECVLLAMTLSLAKAGVSVYLLEQQSFEYRATNNVANTC